MPILYYTMIPSIREILLDYEYKSNQKARQKQRIWSKKQNEMLYNTGRPIFFKNINQENMVKPRHLWYLYENKYRKNVYY